MNSPRGKQVLWISRHTMTEAQKADLERVLGGVVCLTVWPDTVEDVEALRPLVLRSDAVAAVLPPEKLAQLLELAGGRPVLRSVSVRRPTGRWIVLPDGHREQEFAFDHQAWQQILEIRIRTKPL